MQVTRSSRKSKYKKEIDQTLKKQLNIQKLRKFRRNKGFIFTEISGRQHCFIITYYFPYVHLIICSEINDLVKRRFFPLNREKTIFMRLAQFLICSK